MLKVQGILSTLLVVVALGCGDDDSSGANGTAAAGAGAAGAGGVGSGGVGPGDAGAGGAAGEGGSSDAGGEAGSVASDSGVENDSSLPDTMQIAGSSKSRLLTPDVPSADAEALRAGNTAFALDLYGVLRAEAGPSDNLFFSPHSVSIALAMTYAGARENTAAQMADALHFTLEQDRLHPAFNRLDLILQSRTEPSGEDANGFRLNIVNSIWPQKDYRFLPEFLDLLAVQYGAALYLLDFISDPEGSRLVINDWVASQTENRIEDLIPEGVISELTRLVLTNAIYFNAAWEDPFEEADTSNAAFTRLDGTQVNVPMMKQTADLGYARGADWQAVELPYEREELGMAAILPDDFEQFESSFTVSELDAIVAALTVHNTDIQMPRFSFESDFDLSEALKQLGITDAFDDRSDFSGMDGGRDLYIEAVLHKAFIDVNEAGTEAAAATAVVVNWRGMPEHAEIILNRPFLFLIWDRPTGAILFLGRLMDPS